MGKRVGDATRVYGATTGLEGLKRKLHPQRLDANAPIAMEGRCDFCPASLQLPGHTCCLSGTDKGDGGGNSNNKTRPMTDFRGSGRHSPHSGGG